jgi:hypothetical protein
MPSSVQHVNETPTGYSKEEIPGWAEDSATIRICKFCDSEEVLSLISMRRQCSVGEFHGAFMPKPPDD